MTNEQSGSKTKWYARPAVFLVGLGFLSVGLGHMLRGRPRIKATGAVPPLLLC
jgi:hypothetical protein